MHLRRRNSIPRTWWLSVAVASASLACSTPGDAPEPAAPETAEAAEASNAAAATEAGNPQKEAPAAAVPGAGGERTFRWTGVDPNSLDPAKVRDMPGWWIGVNLFEGLMSLPPKIGPAELGVAAAQPTVDASGLKWTFILRKDARWSDGKPVVAQDFVYSWRRLLDPETGGVNAEDLRPIKGAGAILEGKEKDLTTLGVTAPDAHTLVVELEHPLPTFVERVATPPYFPVRKDVVEAHGDQWTRPENLVGNGAYTLAEWAPRKQIVLQKSPTYRGAADVQVERGIQLHVEDENVAWQLYQTDKIDWLQVIPMDRLKDLRAAKSPELTMAPMLCYSGFQFNVRKPPFDQPKVRRAFAMAVDRERLARQVLSRGESPTRHYTPTLLSQMTDYEPPEDAGFDPERAKALLAEAGYPNGQGFPKVTYIYNTYATNRTIAEFIQRNLKDNLGVEVEVENLEFKMWVGRTRQGDFQLSRHSLCGQLDPVQWVELYKTGHPSNTIGFASPEYDALIASINQIADPAERLKKIAEAEKILLGEAVMVPLYGPVRPFLLKDRVSGFFPQPLDVHPLRTIRLE